MWESQNVGFSGVEGPILTGCFCLHPFRGPAAIGLPQHRHGSSAEGGGTDEDGHHAVRRQRHPWPGDLLVQRLPPRRSQRQPGPHQTAPIRWDGQMIPFQSKWTNKSRIWSLALLSGKIPVAPNLVIITSLLGSRDYMLHCVFISILRGYKTFLELIS